MAKLTAEEFLVKAKVHLYEKSPFFSYLVAHLKYIKRDEIPTAGVDNHANFYYNAKFIEKIGEESLAKLIGVLCHEIYHVAFNHPERGEGREVMTEAGTLWNVAVDIVTNNVLIHNNFDLPSEGIIPQNNCIKIGKVEIKDISTKTPEEIYEFLRKNLPKSKKQGQGSSGEGKGNSVQCPARGFDEHYFDKKKDSKEGKGKEKSAVEKAGEKKDWSKIVHEADVYAKQIGKSPLGMEREIAVLHKKKINWRHIIRKEVSSCIPFDFAWERPNKNYLWQEDLYMPSIVGEKIKVLISIDTSGSMSPDDLSLCVSEIIGISRCYPAVEFRLLTHDVDVHDDWHVANGNIAKIKSFKLHGGGGSSFIPLYQYIDKKKYNRSTKLLICFSDGYMEYPDKPSVPSVLILTGNHIDRQQVPSWYRKVLTTD
jgi:predicted metal-dependent peptidase